MRLKSEIENGEILGTAALLIGPDGAVIIDTDVTTWTVELFDLSHSDARERKRVLYTRTVTPATPENTNTTIPLTPLILNTSLTPRNDGYWTGPEPGYSFLFFLTVAALAAATPAVTLQGGRTYRLKFTFNTASWDDITLIHDVTIRAD